MKKLYNYLKEGLLNKSNKKNVTNFGDVIRDLVKGYFSSSSEDPLGVCTWDESTKTLVLTGNYPSGLKDAADMLSDKPGMNVRTDSMFIYNNDRKSDPITINYNISILKNIGMTFDSYFRDVEVRDCTIKSNTSNCEIVGRDGDVNIENVKFIGGGGGAYVHISTRNTRNVPTFKNVELKNFTLIISCTAWKKFFNRIQECVEDGTDPGDVIKMFGLDGIEFMNPDPFITIECPAKGADSSRRKMYLSKKLPKNKKYIEQNGWFIYFS